MLSISLGPIALPVAPLLLLLAIAGASWLADRLWARQSARSAPPAAADPAAGQAASQAVGWAAGLGLLAARGAHVGLNADLYLASPVAMLDLRDGGWHALTGVTVGVAWLAWRGLRTPALRRPLAGAALAGLLFWSGATQLSGAQDKPPLPTLALTALDTGASVDLRRAASGRPVVVNLWASWCGPCRQEMPAFAAAQQRETGVGFLFVNQGEPDSVVRAYLAELGMPLQGVLLDARAQLGPAVGSRGLPTTLFYDAHGRLVEAHFGVLNGPALESRLRTLRAAP